MRIAIIAGDKRGKSGVPVYAQAASAVSGKLNSTADGFPSISSYIDAYKNAQLYDKVLLMDEAVLSEQVTLVSDSVLESLKVLAK